MYPKRVQILFIAFCSMMVFSSCKKKGCTDENAMNYVFEANKDDGSCLYDGKLMFWYDNDTYVNLGGAGVDSLKFYIDNLLMRSIHVSSYSTVEPACEDPGGIKFSRSLESSNSQAAEYTITDQNGTIYFSGGTTFNGGVCTSVQLVYP